jgi:hypothetical protein
MIQSHLGVPLPFEGSLMLLVSVGLYACQCGEAVTWLKD